MLNLKQPINHLCVRNERKHKILPPIRNVVLSFEPSGSV